MCCAGSRLFVQSSVADVVIEKLKERISTLIIGDPLDKNTDIGAINSTEQLATIEKYIAIGKKEGADIYQPKCQLPKKGNWCPPTLFLNVSQSHTIVQEEIFGPVIHVYKYKSNEIEKLISDINKMNYGLTLGIQSRIENTINYIFNNSSVSNIYINRNIVGAVVGVQPFGGRGLSGTGPKAGGPNYLLKFVNEKTYSYDTTAAGGNASLFMLSDNQ